MKTSLKARVEKLEGAAGGGEPLYIVLHCSCPGDEIYGYEWGSALARERGRTIREPGESDDALLARAEREALPALEPWGWIVLNTLSRPAA
jgi:hypothetical protein